MQGVSQERTRYWKNYQYPCEVWQLKKADVLICGAGIVGLTIARELLKQGYENIIIIEKEGSLGRHASGRNSGVLHAGIYYTPDTLKARTCLNGNRLMKQYCRERGLPLTETGKVIVTRDEAEIDTLKGLYGRAVKNGAKAELIDEKGLQEIEPFARTCGWALYSHDTAVVDPLTVLKSLCDDLINSKKVEVLFNTEFKDARGSKKVLTDRGEIGFDYFINAAGAYSDRVAHTFGAGRNYRLIPFKGIYRKLRKEKSFLVRGNIYPVPDIRNPFLGVHFTRSVKGDVYMGPTAIPAFGRENYGVLSGMDAEAFDILFREAVLFMVNPGFREVALSEPRKYSLRMFYKDAKRLVKDLEMDDVIPVEKVGIRPQLVDWEAKSLVSDFVVIRDGTGIHILNAVSPAFTSSMAFAQRIVKEYVH